MSATNTHKIDAARVELLLSELRLPGVKGPTGRGSPNNPTRKAGRRRGSSRRSPSTRWPTAVDAAIERHLAEAPSAGWQNARRVDFEATPMISKAQIMALAAGDAWLDKGENILLFGPPGGGKSHLSAALGLALDRERLARPLPPHHRSRPAFAGRTPELDLERTSPSSTALIC